MENKIKYGVSTWLWQSPFTTESVALFPKIKAMGFNLVEVPVEDPALIDGALVKKALLANGLEAVVCGAFGRAVIRVYLQSILFEAKCCLRAW